MSKTLTVGDAGTGGATVDNAAYRQLDMKKLQDRVSRNVSSEEALEDVIPIQWDDDVLNGNTKVLLIDKK